MSHGVGHSHGSDPSLLWLWCRPVATAAIEALAWEPPCAVGAALKKKVIIFYLLKLIQSYARHTYFSKTT